MVEFDSFVSFWGPHNSLLLWFETLCISCIYSDGIGRVTPNKSRLRNDLNKGFRVIIKQLSEIKKTRLNLDRSTKLKTKITVITHSITTYLSAAASLVSWISRTHEYPFDMASMMQAQYPSKCLLGPYKVKSKGGQQLSEEQAKKLHYSVSTYTVTINSRAEQKKFAMLSSCLGPSPFLLGFQVEI